MDDLTKRFQEITEIESKFLDMLYLKLVNHQPLDELGREIERIYLDAKDLAEQRHAYLAEHGVTFELLERTTRECETVQRRFGAIDREFDRREERRDAEADIYINQLSELVELDPGNDKLKKMLELMKRSKAGEHPTQLSKELSELTDGDEN